MSYEILHFRGSDKEISKKRLTQDVKLTLDYLDDVLVGVVHTRELLRQALEETDWRNGDLNIMEGRRYQYKGMKKSIAIEANFSSYEFILEGLLRLQIGFDKGKITTGLLLLPAHRGEKTPYGSTAKMVEDEIAFLEPTINCPVSVVLYNLRRPVIID